MSLKQVGNGVGTALALVFTFGGLPGIGGSSRARVNRLVWGLLVLLILVSHPPAQAAKPPPRNQPDTTAPAAIGSITLEPMMLAIGLSFTATGDDGATGNATGYEVEFGQPSPDCSGVLAWAPAAGMPNAKPSAVGASDWVVVQQLEPATDYCFRIRVRDEVPNWSAWTVVAGSTLAGSWSSELVSGVRTDASGNPLFASQVSIAFDVDGSTRHVAWVNRPIVDGQLAYSPQVALANDGNGGSWRVSDVAVGHFAVVVSLVARAHPAGGVGVLINGQGQPTYTGVLIEATPQDGGGFDTTESVIGEAGPAMAYRPDGRLVVDTVRILEWTSKVHSQEYRLRQRDHSMVWSEQPLIRRSASGKLSAPQSGIGPLDLAVAPDAGLAVAVNLVQCNRTVYGKEDPANGEWTFYRSAPLPVVQRPSLTFDSAGEPTVVANGAANNRTLWRLLRTHFDPAVVATPAQLPVNVDALCTAPLVEPAVAEAVLSADGADELANHVGVAIDSAGTHLHAMRFGQRPTRLTTLSDCGTGWGLEEVVDTRSWNSAEHKGSAVVDGAGNVVIAYQAGYVSANPIPLPPSSIRLSTRVGNPCVSP
jgi:hypothetical protein